MPANFTDTATTNIDKLTQELISRRVSELLRTGLINLPAGAIAPASMQSFKGSNGTARYPLILDLDATPGNHELTEGVPPTGQELAVGYEEMSVVQHGDVANITDVALFQTPQALAEVAGERIARQMAAVIDKLAADAWANGANAIFSGTGNTNTNQVAPGDVLLSSEVKRAVALLEGSSVPRFGGNFYTGLIHPYAKFDLELDDDAGGWIDASRYAGSTQLMNGELGKFAGVRFISDASVSVFSGDGSSGNDVYVTTILGPASIAFGDLGTKEIFGGVTGGVSDPLHQIVKYGWKAYLGCVLVGEGDNATNVQDPRYINIQSASSI